MVIAAVIALYTIISNVTVDRTVPIHFNNTPVKQYYAPLMEPIEDYLHRVFCSGGK